MANDNRKQRVPFAFLEDIRRRFRSQFGDAIHSAIAFSFNEEFAPTLQGQMAFYNSDPSSDQIGQVKSQLEDVKGVMVENIEKVLERGEKIELLVDKTDRLNQTAFKFEKVTRAMPDTRVGDDHTPRTRASTTPTTLTPAPCSSCQTSKQLKNAMFWKTVRMYAMAAAVVVLLGLFVAASACGGVTFEKCRSDDDN